MELGSKCCGGIFIAILLLNDRNREHILTYFHNKCGISADAVQIFAIIGTAIFSL